MARSGDDLSRVRCVPLAQWPQLLVDPRTELEIDRRFFGYAVRTDRWQCRQSSRPWQTIYLVLDGEAPGAVDGEPYRLGPNSLFWLSPGVPLDMHWSARFVFTEVWFRVFRGGRMLRLPEPVIIEEGAQGLWPLFQEIEEELTNEASAAEAKLRHLLALVAIEVARLRERTSEPRTLGPIQRRRIAEYVRRQLSARPSPAELAEVVGLSPDYFSRVFHATYGCSPRDWLVRERIREAARMLTSTGMTAYQVADHLGYGDVSQFSRQFKQVLGVSPGRYRRTR